MVDEREYLEQRIESERRMTERWQSGHDREHVYLAEAVKEAKRVVAATVALVALLVAIGTFVVILSR